MNIDHILKVRGEVHGPWADQAGLAHKLKELLRRSKNWKDLSPGQQEALDAIAVKTSRILEGQPQYPDHWDDIVGYAKLGRQSMPYAAGGGGGGELDPSSRGGGG